MCLYPALKLTVSHAGLVELVKWFVLDMNNKQCDCGQTFCGDVLIAHMGLIINTWQHILGTACFASPELLMFTPKMNINITFV